MSEATAKQSKAEQPTQGNTKQHKATQKKRAIQSNSGQYKAIKSSKAEIRNPKRGRKRKSSKANIYRHAPCFEANHCRGLVLKPLGTGKR